MASSFFHFSFLRLSIPKSLFIFVFFPLPFFPSLPHLSISLYLTLSATILNRLIFNFSPGSYTLCLLYPIGPRSRVQVTEEGGTGLFLWTTKRTIGKK